MGCERRAVLFHHLICVAVVCCDKCYAALCKNCVNRFAYALVNCFYCCYGCVEHACVTYHVAVCIVEDNCVILVRLYSLENFVANKICAHFRLEVISCYLW